MLPPVQVKVTYVTVPVGPKVAVKNFSSKIVTDEEIVAACAAFNRQMNEHFALPPPFGWGIGMRVRACVGDQPPPQPDEWLYGLYEVLDVSGALAYHDRTPEGLPFMKGSPEGDVADGAVWTVSASHELCETNVDPELSSCSQAPDGMFWAKEVCDGVEATEYLIDGVRVSNFALPTYFEEPQRLAGVRFDYLGLCKVPRETLPGGYNQFWDPKVGWREVDAKSAKRAHRIRREQFGRAGLRAAKFTPKKKR